MTKKLTEKEKLDRLRAALLADKRPQSTRLVTRLDRCHVDWKSRFECRSPACWHCRRRYIARESRVTQQNFGYLANDKLAFVSVVVGGSSDVTQIGDFIRQNRDNTRKRLAALRSKSTAWNSVYLQGWHEVDAVCARQIPVLASKRRPLIEQIAPVSFSSDGPAWLTTWHGIMHTNGLPVEEIAYEFRRQWPLERQVDVAAFDEDKSVEENLAYLTSYANKFECSVALTEGVVEIWPSSWKVEFFGWLQGFQRNPFEALRFSVNPQHDVSLPPKPVGLMPLREPLPCSFSRVSTYEYTGARP